MNLDLPKASGPDCIPMVVLKNCEPELSYILAELFKKCLKKSCFPDCWKVSSVVPVFKNVGERSTAKNYCPVSLLSVVSKVFEMLVNNRIVGHLEKCGLFSDFQYGFRFSQSTADLLTVASDRIARAFNRSGATRAVDDVICDIAIYADDTTLYSKCDRASDMWQQLESASEFESDLQDTVDWGKKWLVDFNAGKTQLVSFDRSNNNGSIDVKMGGSILGEKSSFKMLGLTFSSKLDWGSYIISIAKPASKKIGVLIRSMKFRSEVALYLCKSTIRPCMEYCCHVWAGTTSCCYKNGYAGLLVLHLLLLLYPWLIVEMWPT